MKKVCISLGLILIICLSAAAFYGSDASAVNGGEEYLRIHIRANSNSDADQSVKREIKELVVSYLTDIVLSSGSKDELVEKIENNKNAINGLIDGFLSQKGFDYGAQTTVRNEKFPTRCYNDLTLEEGYYDAVVIELGSGRGDNWWCVVYPPLCFTRQGDVRARSLIYEYLERFFNAEK